MPITEELTNLKKLESVGFTHEQSEVLADVIEKAQVSGQESLKEYIHSELKELRGEFRDLENRLLASQKELENRLLSSQKELENRLVSSQKELENRLLSSQKELENRLLSSQKGLENRLLSYQKDLEILMVTSQKDMLIKIFGIIVGSLTVAVTILKLFP
jgi:hypothetical protein